MMYNNYLRTAYRVIARHKTFSLINVIGLAVGITAALIIALYAHHELSYDRFHPWAEQTYLVYKERVTPNGVQPTYDTWVPLLERMQQEFPDIQTGTRLYAATAEVLLEDERFEEEVAYVDPAFFEVFSFPLQLGDTQNPLPNQNSVVITTEAAQRFFGDQNPLGQSLTLDYDVTYTVSGVLATIPTNSSIQFDLAVPARSMRNYAELADEWGASFLSTYVVLPKAQKARANLEKQFPAFVASIYGEEVQARTHFRLLPLTQSYDTFIGNRQDVYMLLWIALGTILIAAINFTNLSTARAMERMKEIGMRKVLGANRPQLISQFLSEALLLSLIALGLGVLLAELLLPWVNQAFGLSLALPMTNIRVLSGLLGFGVLLGLLSGSYPALFLSGFRISSSLKGTSSEKSRGLNLRNGLVVVQFALSVLLISGTLIVGKQLTYMKEADMAFEQENVVVLPVGLGSFAGTAADSARLQTFKESLSQHSHIQDVSSSAHIPTRWDGWFTFVQPKGWEGDPMRMRMTYADAHYFSTFHINFQEGRPFHEGSETDRNEAVILNRAALNAFGWESAEGQYITRGRQEFAVVGVVDDYHFETLRNEVAPILHFYRPPENGVHQYISVRADGENLRETLAFMETQWNQLTPERPFEYSFLDQNIARMYESEDRLLTMVGVFSFIAIVIACLGLFGLSLNTIVKRTKEIGIRKVLGASVTRIVLLLSRDFVRLVLLAILIAAPLAYFAMQHWLQDFAYRIPLRPGVLLMAGGIALFIALATISVHAIKSALTNPTRSLRSE